MIDFNKEKQISYWITTALSDIELAEIVIANKKILHGLFCCHLAIEKALKAHFVKVNNTFAPKTHDLVYLIKKSDLVLEPERELFVAEIMRYQLEGRYPEYHLAAPPLAAANQLLKQSKEFLEWLLKKL